MPPFVFEAQLRGSAVVTSALKPDDVVDGKYLVHGVCSSQGGMGEILFVEPVTFRTKRRLVLKYCKSPNEEERARFRREVRLLSEFAGNGRVVEILDTNLEYDPPYFVMPYYESGDLTRLNPRLKTDYALQERVFLEMIDCVAELHARGIYHRDIKPQNFLIDGARIVVSDFGLSTEAGSGTALTRSSVFWGTHGYLPPEYAVRGGFKSASPVGDIFMLGKSFYTLITERDPTYILQLNVPDALYFVIQAACDVNPDRRPKTLADLKQRLVAAFDVILGRLDAFGAAQQALANQREQVRLTNKFDQIEIVSFIERLAECGHEDKQAICRGLTKDDMRLLVFPQVAHLHRRFLAVYEEMVDAGNYAWAFAETISSNMSVFFLSPDVSFHDRAYAFRIAANAAHKQNRYAAMDICRDLVIDEMDESLALLISGIIMEMKETFLGGIEPSLCKNGIVRKTLKDLREQRDLDDLVPF